MNENTTQSGFFEKDDIPEFIPVRILNEFIYCPRLAYLEWVQREFSESVDTVQGSFDHRIVDSPPESRQKADGAIDEFVVLDSVYMSAPVLGMTAVMDRVEFRGKTAVPVDFKHGKKPGPGISIWETDKIQLTAQALILEENGYQVTEGVIYYVSNRKRVVVPLDGEVRSLTRSKLEELRASVTGGIIPPPLDDSPKCPRCSLVGICLPDETEFLHRAEDERIPEQAPRMILPSADETLPVYIQTQGFSVGKKKGVLVVKDKRTPVQDIPMHEISSLSLFGGVQISTQAIQALCYRDIPICFFSHGGWFYGVTHGLGHRNIEQRIHQHRSADSPQICLTIARQLIRDKILNSRTLLRRNGKDVPEKALRRLSAAAENAAEAKSLESLLGTEGTAAKIYFAQFQKMLKQHIGASVPHFVFAGRNRRPPRDPVNALLSFAYSLLTKTWMVTLYSVGFDPFLGFYHGIRYGRPALALDMMEPFRSIIADSCVISVINTGIVKPDDFILRLNAAALKKNARSGFIQAFERALSRKITHPVFGYKISYRQVFEVQARLLGRFLSREIHSPPSFVTR